MIEDKDIRDINHVRYILDNLQEYVKAYEEQIGELPEYKCEDITFQLAEIDSFLIGMQKLTATNMAMADIRVMKYWKYLEGEYTFTELMEFLRKYEGEV